ncbi:MAG: ABC transporter permease [Pleurocapsa minor GSE-CHR-MK-17-07R]|jgi:ABC-type dipeptide/oligopeptide/nickel transport system permease component|nr:ABC transporter permease [Pleurocapsa minor GSE-CHR-MK 17-07R]
MTKFILRRLLWMILVMFVVSVITFGLMRAVPGGPFSREKPLPQATLDALNAKYRLDEPLIVQYLVYMGDIVVPRIGPQTVPSADEDYLIEFQLPAIFGENQSFKWVNFGPTYSARGRSVNDIFRENMPVSAQLGVAAFLVAVSIGIPLGVAAALNRNKWQDFGAMGVSIIGVSVPVIISAPVLQYLVGVQWRILPVTGWGTLNHLILPAFTLGFASSALIARLMRASLLQVMNEDYIRTARAKGVAESGVITFHALKNGLLPVVTVLGPLFAALVTGTFVVETVFGVPGIGRYFVTAVQGRDYPVVMGTILLYAGVLVISNLLVDVVYAWLDPRIRFD